MPFDERVSQSLVGRAVALQQPQLALSFVMASFPCYFKATESRVPMTWIDYISQRHSKYSQNVSCFDWAVRCMTTIYLGSLHNDARYMDEGRMCYLRSLRGLSIILSDPRAAKSDEALSTVIILGVFEMHAYTSIEGWKHHARGLRTLMQLRGPGAHADGFGCNLYMACRNTIVTAALVSGEECFLEQPEWQQLNECLAAKNAKNANSSALEDIAERAFREVVKLPGFVKRLREMPGLAASAQNHERPALLRKIVATRTAMKGIYTEFVISASTVRAGFASYADFVGPIPHVFFHKFADLTIHGIRSGLLLLNYLVILLNPSQRPAAETEILDIMGSMRSPRRPSLCEGRDNLSLLSSTVPPQSLGELSLMIESRLIPEASQPPTSDWMDDIATSMGLEGVRISLVQSSSFQTIED
ncbi:hypothetical protein N7462_005921 [Penicillium macrosclerotiorum]|uniref:uncharacterized protein n=1 Tax=Penicillium macrosclerotiorum TaxID=303699 RepID=UPI0025494CC3|nr:uncharacterized protein N7462_005921 [Penicillium macrosclerotiorum]KAJ5682756.1 hypothetical protein N7462_005921 [Penicillium macrosclerotiorum]